MRQTRRDWIRRSWFGSVAAVLGGLFVSHRAKAKTPNFLVGCWDFDNTQPAKHTHLFENMQSRWMQKFHGRFDSDGDYLRLDMWISDELARDLSGVVELILHKQAMEQIIFAVAAKREFLLTGKWPQEWLDAQPKLVAVHTRTGEVIADV